MTNLPYPNQLLARAGRWAALHRDAIGAALAWAACVLMALSAYAFRPMPESLIHYRPTSGPEVHYRPAAPWLLLGGAITLGLALRVSRRALPLPRVVALRWTRAGLRGGLATLAGALALAALAEANGALAGVSWLAGLSHHAQFALLVAGCALVAWGLGGAGAPRLAAVPWREVTLVALITLLALGLRVWELGDAVRVLVDENHFTVSIRVFWDRAAPDVKLLAPMPTAASSPYLYSYWQAGAVELFGRTLFGLRVVSAVFGALMVPALYLLARALFDRRAAVLAALIVATFPPHLHFTRLGMNIVADPLFGTFALAFLARGLRGGRRADWAAGGVLLGLTQYFYEAGRLLFPLVALGWLAGGWLVWRPRPALRGLLIAALAFALVALPVYYTLAGLDFTFTSRLERTRLGDDYWERDREPDTLHTRLVHFRHSLMLYVNAPENTTVYYFLYYGGAHPFVLEWFVPLLLLGAGAVLWSWRRPAVLPLLWVLATSAGNALLVESAVAARYNVVFPALALLIAAGLRLTLPLLWPPRWPRRARDAVLLAGGVVIAVWQAAFYFGPFLDTFNVEARDYLERDTEDALLRAASFPPGTSVFLVGERLMPPQDAQHFADFLADDLTVTIVPPEAVTPDWLLSLPRDHDVAIFVGRDELLLIGQLFTTLEPQFVELTNNPDIPLDKQFTLYYLPAQK